MARLCVNISGKVELGNCSSHVTYWIGSNMGEYNIEETIKYLHTINHILIIHCS